MRNLKGLPSGLQLLEEAGHQSCDQLAGTRVLCVWQPSGLLLPYGSHPTVIWWYDYFNCDWTFHCDWSGYLYSSGFYVEPGNQVANSQGCGGT